MGMKDRTKLILKQEGIDKLASSSVIIFGVGGVGGYVCEMLARTGVGNITMVDFDVVSDSNLNRQIVALNSTIGVEKVLVMKNRIMDINPECNVTIKIEKLTPENIQSFNLKNYDYVVDCIDMVKSKIALIDYCFKHNIKIISSMGTGNKNGIPNFQVCDVFETKYDGLARVLRRELKKLGVTHSNVVCTNEQSIGGLEAVGSLVYYPAMCGCVLSAYVIKNLCQ